MRSTRPQVANVLCVLTRGDEASCEKHAGTAGAQRIAGRKGARVEAGPSASALRPSGQAIQSSHDDLHPQEVTLERLVVQFQRCPGSKRGFDHRSRRVSERVDVKRQAHRQVKRPCGVKLPLPTKCLMTSRGRRNVSRSSPPTTHSHKAAEFSQLVCQLDTLPQPCHRRVSVTGRAADREVRSCAVCGRRAPPRPDLRSRGRPQRCP